MADDGCWAYGGAGYLACEGLLEVVWADGVFFISLRMDFGTGTNMGLGFSDGHVLLYPLTR